MLDRPLDRAWAHLIDEILFEKAEKWEEDVARRKVLMFLHAIEDGDVEQAMQNADEFLLDNYRDDQGSLRALQEALQNHYIDDNGELQRKTEDVDSPSIWDSQAVAFDAITHALTTAQKTAHDSASQLRDDIDVMTASRYYHNNPNVQLKYRAADAIFHQFFSGDIWQSDERDSELLGQAYDKILRQIEDGTAPDEWYQYGDAHLMQEAKNQAMRNKRKLPAMGKYTVAELLNREGKEGLERQFARLLEAITIRESNRLAKQLIQEKTSPRVDARVNVAVTPEDRQWLDRERQKVVKTPQFKAIVESKMRNLRGSLPDYSQEAMQRIAESEAADTLLLNDAREHFRPRVMLAAKQHDAFINARKDASEAIEKFEEESDLSPEEELDAISASRFFQNLFRSITIGGQHGVLIGEINDSNLRGIIAGLERLSPEARDMVLSWFGPNGKPLLASLVNIGTRGRADAEATLPEDALEQIAQVYADENNTKEKIMKYLTQTISRSQLPDEEGELLPEEERISPDMLKGITPRIVNLSRNDYKESDIQQLQNLAVMNNNNQKLSPSERELIRTVRNLSHPTENREMDNQLDVPFTDIFESIFDPTMDAGQSLRAMTRYSTLQEGTRKDLRKYKRLQRLRKLLLNYDGSPKDYTEILGSEDFQNFYSEEAAALVARERFKGRTDRSKQYVAESKTGLGSKGEEKERFDDIMGRSTARTKCPHCDIEGNSLKYGGPCEKSVDPIPENRTCKDGYVIEREALGAMTEMNKERVNELFGELLGFTLSPDNKRVPNFRYYGSDPEQRAAGYTPGLIAQAHERDIEIARQEGMEEICPKCEGSGETEYGGLCQFCQDGRGRLDSTTGFRVVPNLKALYVSRGFGQAADGTYDRNKLQSVKRIDDFIRKHGLEQRVPTWQEEEAARALSWGEIPADGRTTHFHTHPLLFWHALHRKGGPLSEEGVKKARAFAAKEMNETDFIDSLSEDSKKERFKDILGDYYQDIFTRIPESLNEFERELVENIQPEKATNTRWFHRFLELMSKDLDGKLTPLTMQSLDFKDVMNHLTHLHSPDYDGRNERTDEGLMEKTACTTCHGDGLLRNIVDEPMPGKYCTGCQGTGSEGVRKTLLRQPWIKQAYSRDKLLHLHNTGKLERELGRPPSVKSNRYLSPQGASCAICDGGHDIRYHQTDISYLPNNREKFRADMFLKGGKMKLPSYGLVENITLKEQLYRELHTHMQKLAKLRRRRDDEKFGFSPDAQRYLTAGEVEAKIDELEKILTKDETRNALLQYHDSPDIVPEFSDEWRKNPYLFDSSMKQNEFTEELFNKMPCPYCNYLHSIGELKGQVPTIKQHREDADDDFAEITAVCPELEKTRPEEASLTDMYYQIKNMIGKNDEEILFDKAYEIFSPTLDEINNHFMGRGTRSTPSSSIINLSSKLGIPTMILRSPYMIANARVSNRLGTNPYNDKNYGSRASVQNPLYGMGAYNTRHNLSAVIGTFERFLPQNRHSEHELAKIMAYHILDPTYHFGKHGNPLNIPPLHEVKYMLEQGKTMEQILHRTWDKGELDLWEWARRTLGKDKSNDYSDYNLDEHERRMLDRHYERLHPLLVFAKEWGKMDNAGRRLILDKMGLTEVDFPRSIFNFSKDGSFIVARPKLNNIIQASQNYAHELLKSETDGGYDADSAGFLQPYENHPSMEYFYHLMDNKVGGVNAELLAAWKQHDDETLAKYGDQWVVTGKTLPEIRESGLLDDLWKAITRGIPIVEDDPVSGQKQIMETDAYPTLEEISGYNGFPQMKGNWYLLMNEILLRANNKQLSKEKFANAGRFYPQTGTNDLGTGTRCMSCRGRGHAMHMDDAQFWWSGLNPFEEDGRKEHVPHIAGRRLQTISNTGDGHARVNWSHPDSISWMHDSVKTPLGDEGVEGWHKYFNILKDNELLPEDAEIFDAEGGFTDQYIDFLATSPSECLHCEGAGHCHNCGGTGAHTLPRDKNITRNIHNINSFLVLNEMLANGDFVDEDGHIYPEFHPSVYQKSDDDLMLEYLAGRSLTPDDMARLNVSPLGPEYYLDGIPYIDEAGLPQEFGSHDQFVKDRDRHYQQFIVDSLKEAQKKYLDEKLEEAAFLTGLEVPTTELGGSGRKVIQNTSSVLPTPESFVNNNYVGIDEKFQNWYNSEDTSDTDRSRIRDISKRYYSTYRDLRELPSRNVSELQKYAKKILGNSDNPEEKRTLSEVLNPSDFAKFPTFEDWRLGEWVQYDPDRITLYSQTDRLMDEFQKQTGLDLVGNKSQWSDDDIHRLYYAIKEQNEASKDVFPSWFTDTHKHSMLKDGVIAPKGHYDTVSGNRDCEYPNCGEGLEHNEGECRICAGSGKHTLSDTGETVDCHNCEGEGRHAQPLAAIYGPNAIGIYNNPYGHFCQNHHDQMMHEIKVSDGVLNNMRIFGGQELLKQILRHSDIDSSQLAEALSGEPLEQRKEGKIRDGVMQGKQFAGFQTIQGTHGNEDYLMPMFFDENGRRQSLAYLGEGYDSENENKMVGYYDKHGWDYGGVANHPPLIDISGVMKLYDDATTETIKPHWSKPSGRTTVCPQCLRQRGQRSVDRSPEGLEYAAQNKKSEHKTYPDCECGYAFSYYERDEDGKLKEKFTETDSNYLPMRNLLFAAGQDPETAKTAHDKAKKYRERLKERLRAIANGEEDPGLLRGVGTLLKPRLKDPEYKKEQPINRVSRFSGNLVEQNPNDPRNPQSLTKNAFIDGVQRLFLQGTDSKGKPKYRSKEAKKMIDKLKILLHDDFHVNKMHDGFGNYFISKEYGGLSTATSVNSFIKKLHEEIEKPHPVSNQVSRFNNAVMRLSDGVITHPNQTTSVIRLAGKDRITMDEKAQKIVKKAHKIFLDDKKEGKYSPEEIKDAQTLYNMTMSMDIESDEPEYEQILQAINTSRRLERLKNLRIHQGDNSRYLEEDPRLTLEGLTGDDAPEKARKLLDAMASGAPRVNMMYGAEKEDRPGNVPSQAPYVFGIKPDAMYIAMNNYVGQAMDVNDRWQDSHFASNEQIDENS